MNLFPMADVIPLPAPVWLFKTFHILLLGLHFVAIQLLIGGLVISTYWVVRGGRRADGGMREAGRQVLKTLPVVTTYLINLGVPPLLFAQVLFGHALYSASVMVGAWWIGVIFWLLSLYYLLYVATGRGETGRDWWKVTASALAMVMVVAFTFSTVMTLMLRPEAWADMYRQSAGGVYLPQGDPTTVPRWLYMLSGGLTLGGLGVVALGSMKRQTLDLRTLMFRDGAVLIVVGALLQTLFANLAWTSQPTLVHDALASGTAYSPLRAVWLLNALAILGFGAWIVAGGRGLVERWGRKASVLGWIASLLGVSLTLVYAAFRDGVRDKTMLVKGFDVTQLPVHINWSVLIAFLLMVAATLVSVGWLTALVVTNQPQVEAENE